MDSGWDRALARLLPPLRGVNWKYGCGLGHALSVEDDLPREPIPLS